MVDPGLVCDAQGLSVRLLERTDLKILQLREASLATINRLESFLNVAAWPIEPNHSTGKAPRISWMTPRQWLLVDSELTAERLHGLELGTTWHLADMMFGRAIFEISGSRARDLMAKTCLLDLHPRSFHAGRCARTEFARVPVMIDQISDAPLFRLFADISYRRHLETWFEDAAREFDFAGNDQDYARTFMS